MGCNVLAPQMRALTLADIYRHACYTFRRDSVCYKREVSPQLMGGKELLEVECNSEIKLIEVVFYFVHPTRPERVVRTGSIGERRYHRT